jgi:O-antigen/teichoic acid export membrane protein
MTVVAKSPGLYQAAGRAAVWQLVGGGWQMLVRLGGSIFLARALEPSDFGLFGMAMLVQEFISYLGAFGFQIGLIAKKDVAEEDVSTCFWAMAGIRALLFLGGELAAPLAGLFFGDPRLVNVVRAVSCVFLCQAIEVIPSALLTKELRFRTLNVIQAAALTLETCLAVTLAVTTSLGYWSLVIAMIVGATASAVATAIVVRWLPRFMFSRTSFRYLSTFGGNTLGFSIVNYFHQNLDYLLVGRLLGANALGLYEYAYRIPHLVFDRIVRPIGQVAFPAFAKMRDDDTKIIEGYLKTVQFLAIVAFPMLTGLTVVADVAVPLLWGPRWVPVVTPLRVLCLCAALRCIPQAAGAVLYCKDRPDIPFKIGVVGLMWTGVIVGILGRAYGVLGVAYGMMLSVLPSYWAVVVAFRLTNAPLNRLARAMAPVVVASAACAFSGWTAELMAVRAGAAAALIVASAATAGAAAYGLTMFLFFKPLIAEVLEACQTVAGRRVPANVARWLRNHGVRA